MGGRHVVLGRLGRRPGPREGCPAASKEGPKGPSVRRLGANPRPPRRPSERLVLPPSLSTRHHSRVSISVKVTSEQMFKKIIRKRLQQRAQPACPRPAPAEPLCAGAAPGRTRARRLGDPAHPGGPAHPTHPAPARRCRSSPALGAPATPTRPLGASPTVTLPERPGRACWSLGPGAPSTALGRGSADPREKRAPHLPPPTHRTQVPDRRLAPRPRTSPSPSICPSAVCPV